MNTMVSAFWRQLNESDAMHPLRALLIFEPGELIAQAPVSSEPWYAPAGLDVKGGQRKRAFWIVNKHLNGDRDLLMCQDELIEAGLAEYAKL